MNFICVCSGISSPTSAWSALGWNALAYAEIDPFASAILAARYGAGRPRFMPDPAEPGLDQKEARARANAIKALSGVEWGEKTPNFGDFTRLRDESFIVDADVLVGGTPCQDFSLAGLRASLGGARGNLTLEFIRLANAVDDLRRDAGKPPAFILWENVPGVFSTKDNAFGTFLGGLVGSERPILPPKGRGWTDAGVVSGPERMAAWRVLDAQHFGLAQRRRRVFVLASRYPRAWAVADALLPIIDSLCGHPPPRREAGAGVARSLSASTGGPSAKEQQYTFVAGDRPLNALDEREGDDPRSSGGPRPGAGGAGDAGGGGERAVLSREAYGGRFSGPVDVSPTLLAHKGSGVRFDLESDAFVVEHAAEISPTLLAGANETGGSRPPGSTVDTAESLIVTAFSPASITSPGNVSNPQPGDPAPTLTQDNRGVAIAFSSKDDGGDAGELAPTLRAMNHHHSHPNAGGQIAVAFSMRGRDGENMAEPEADPVSPAIRTGGGDSSKPMVAITQAFNLSPGSGSDGLPSATEAEVAHSLTASGQADQNGRGTHIVQSGAQAFKPSHFTRGKDGAPSELAPALTADADKGDQDAILFAPKTEEEVRAFTIAAAANGYAWENELNPTLMARAESPGANLFSGLRVGSMVRRLTLVECERLQGFPDNFTLIPWSDARRDAQDFEETVLYLLQHGFGDNEARVLASTPDGPRYRVLGNSMAKDVIEDLGRKIELAKELRDGPPGAEFP